MDRDGCYALGFDFDAFMLTPPSSSADNRESVSLYILRCERFVKIGIAGNVARRIGAMQPGNPFPIKLLREVKYQSRLYALLAERTIHAVLSDDRHWNEWFTCDERRARDVVIAVRWARSAAQCGWEKHAAKWEHDTLAPTTRI